MYQPPTTGVAGLSYSWNTQQIVAPLETNFRRYECIFRVYYLYSSWNTYKWLNYSLCGLWYNLYTILKKALPSFNSHVDMYSPIPPLPIETYFLLHIAHQRHAQELLSGSKSTKQESQDNENEVIRNPIIDDEGWYMDTSIVTSYESSADIIQ